MPKAPLTDRQRYHQAHKQPENRPSPSKRGYGRVWRRLRLLKLRETPICETPDCHQPATEVDHIVPLRKGGDNSMANLQSLCHRCHSRKTAREDGAFGR